MIKKRYKLVLHASAALLLLMGGTFQVHAEQRNRAAGVQDVQGIAQQTNVSGVVKDEAGEPLIGVSIKIKGNETKGTITDENGGFTLSCDAKDILMVSYMGYIAQELKVGNNTTLNIVLKEDSKLLDEIIVIGYGTTTRKSAVGAVDQVKGSQIAEKPVANMSQALQGASSALTIQNKGFDPTSDNFNINVRGLTTMNNNQPLLVIDGLVSDDASFNRLNPSDIESVSVLKDAGTAAIYGSRAAAGVILITTKKGVKNQKATVNFNAQFGLQDPKILVEPVAGYQNALLRNLALTNTGSNPAFTPEQIRDLYSHEDSEWLLKSLIEDAYQQNYNLSVSGGGQNSTYMVSAGYFKQGSNYIGDASKGIERYNVRSNLTAEYGRFKLTSILAYTRNNIKSGDVPLGDAMRQPTYYMYQPKVNGKWMLTDVLTESNPIASATEGSRTKKDNDYVNLNFGLDFKIIDGLKVRGVLGADLFYDHTFNDSRQPALYDNADSTVPKKAQTRGIEESNTKKQLFNMQFLLDYDKTFGKHHITGLLGATNESYTSKGSTVKQNLVDLDLGIPTDITEYPTGNKTGNQNTDKTSITSILGRASYSFDEKYYGEVSFREDGSSKFTSNNRWGFFPSVSLGWRMTEESFLTDIKDKVGDLKLRTSYGILGNQRVDNYQAYTTYQLYSDFYAFDNKIASGAGFKVGNPNLRWEKTATFNVGVDASLLNGALSVTADWFNKRTKDILLKPVFPSVLGTDPQDYNQGELDVKGWDVTINYRLRSGEFNHNFNFNIGDTWNKIIKFEGNEQIKKTEEFWTLTRVGLPVGTYYGYKTDGYFQSYEEINNSATPTGLSVQPGDLKFVDRNNDGVIDEKDRFVLGNAFPRYTFGFTYNVQFKNFDFSAFFQGVGKRDMDIRGELLEPFHAGYSYVIYKHQLDFWTPTHTDAKYPILAINGSDSNKNNYGMGSDRNILDGKYVRLKDISFGYTLPADLTQKIGIGKARVYVNGQNLLTLSKYSFVDPEASQFNNNMSNGGAAYSARAYPSLKYYGVGIDIQF